MKSMFEGICQYTQTRPRIARLFLAFALLCLGWKLTSAQQAVSTLAGSGSAGSNNGIGTAASFQFSTPAHVAVDGSGNIYIADPGNHVIRRLVASTGEVTTYAGAINSSGFINNNDRTLARFNQPRGISIDGAGNLYVADSGNNAIRMITSAGVVSTLAGGTAGFANGTGTDAQFSSPFGVAADRAGGGGAAVNVYVADSQNHTIRQIVVTSRVVSTVAGSPGLSGNAGGSGSDARFNRPDAIVSNSAGTVLYVADRFNHLIRQVAVAGGVGTVTTLAGSGTQGQTDATGTQASFDNPAGIALDGSNNVLVGDTFNHTIRSITTPGGVVTTIAGAADQSGTANGLASAARFNFPTGIAVSGATTYVIDTNNQLVRRISAAVAPSIQTQPAAASVSVNGNASFSVVVSSTTNPSPTYQWQIQPAGTTGFTNLNANSTYAGVTAATLTVNNATSAMNGDRFQVVVSNGVGSPATSSSALLTVTQAPAITSPASANFVVGQTTQFTVVATGVPAPSLSATGVPSWASFNTSTGVLTGAPSSSDSSATITFSATNSVSTVNQTFAATVTTTSAPQFTGPSNQQVVAGSSSATFSVSNVTGTPNTFNYQWQRRAAGAGSFTNLSDTTIDGASYSGSATATLNISGITPAMNGDAYQVVVTNAPGSSTTSSIATLQVAPVVTSPASTTFVNNNTFGSFTVTANGNPAPTISIAGSLPNGVSINGATISGIPTDVFSASYPLTVTASNSGGTTTQSFTLLVSAPQAPAFTSASSATFRMNQFGTFTFTAAGAPSPTIQLLGSLPDGLAFNSPTLSGTPTTATGSAYTLTAVATNSSGTVSQTFSLTVEGIAPTITTHPSSVSANVGQTVQFTAAATGTPTPNFRWQRQPNGTIGFVNLSDDATFSGTNTNTLTITNVSAIFAQDQFRLYASNGTTPDAASNAATLTVNLGTVITTIAGQAGFSGSNNGSGSTARFNSPSGVAVDAVGNVYIADTANHVIRRMGSDGIVTTIAGLAGVSGTANGSASESRFNSPQGVAVDAVGNVYVADTLNHAIRVISVGGGVSTVAGLNGTSGAVDGAPADARFLAPTGLALDNTGGLYVADSGNNAIRRILIGGGVSTYAGALGQGGFVDNVGAANARFSGPTYVTVDSSGNVYVSDSGNHVVRRIGSGGGTVVTLAGVGGLPGVSDGTSSAARFNRPGGLSLDTSGNLYVADTLSSTLRRISNIGEVTTVAGLATSIGASDGAGTTARFNQPIGVAIDISGNVYVADTRNHTIRRSGSPTAPQFTQHPANRIAAVGGTTTFTANASGIPAPGYQWQRQGPDTFGFVNLVNDTTFSGVTTSTLTINNVTSALNGNQFQVIANNGVASVTSNSASLTLGSAPAFTSPATATFQAGRAGSFTVTATSDPVATFTASDLPPWASLNATTGEISGTPPNTNGSPFTVTVIANNGATSTQTLTITVTPAVEPPRFTSQPASLAINEGQTAIFSPVVAGTGPFSYQWRRNGSPINAATGATLAIPNAQSTASGIYTVVVTNSVASVISEAAALVVNTLPTFTVQPAPQIALPGSEVTFRAVVSGGGPFNYQWRRNGVALPGATASSLTIANVSPGNDGNYDVIVSNPVGATTSSLAQLTIVSAPTAPVIVAQPSSRVVSAGSSVTLAAVATGAPAPGYQWRKNGANIPGASTATFTIDTAQGSDGGVYDAIISNSVGSITSTPAILRVISRSYAGTYFGSIGAGLGTFALYVRDDNTGVFLGYIPGATAPVMNLDVLINDDGTFSFSQTAVSTAPSGGEVPLRASALAPVGVTGTIGSDGTLSGSISGGANANLTATRAADAGVSQSSAGFYRAGSTNSSAQVYTIAGANGQAFVVVQGPSTFDGGTASVGGTGLVTFTTTRTAASQTLSGGTVNGSSSGAVNATLVGGGENALARQRLVNISSRARVGSGEQVAIAGFVISGEHSKPVLIRAVGPTLGAAPFNVPGALASPRLELFRGSTSLAVNAGVSTSRAAIDAAGLQAGAFALGSAGTDAAILTTLAPGNYTAVVSSTNNTAGVALIEVYDLSAAAPGQKLLNISTRANAGANENTLIAGFVVPPGTAKRVLIRGVGPGLTPLGVTGVLPAPTLTLISGATTVATNSNWSTSPDSAAISAASAQVGAFGMANADAAMIVTLNPGNYTAQVTGANNATGVALIEVYELP